MPLTRCDHSRDDTRKRFLVWDCSARRCWRRESCRSPTAYSISEALGFEKGVSRSFREAPIFLGTFTFLVAVGAAIAVVPNLPLIRVLLVTQVINGLLLPIVLFAVLRLVNDRELMGAHVNGPLYNIAAWLTAILVTILSLLFILITVIFRLSRFAEEKRCRCLVLVSRTKSFSSWPHPQLRCWPPICSGRSNADVSAARNAMGASPRRRQTQ